MIFFGGSGMFLHTFKNFHDQRPSHSAVLRTITNPKLPGGAPNISKLLCLALGKKKTGGTVLPIELMIIHMVITVPHSPETACPTCFVPS